MPLSQAEAKKVAEQIIGEGTKLFGPPKLMDGAVTMVPEITVDNNIGRPEGGIVPITDSSYGLEVSKELLNIQDTTAVKFAIGHEIGHGFSQIILSRIGLKGISGDPEEVVADISSAYLLTKIGIGWQNVLDSVDKGTSSGIFTEERKGHHPPGPQRATYVHSLFSLMADKAFGRSFEAAAKLVLSNIKK